MDNLKMFLGGLITLFGISSITLFKYLQAIYNDNSYLLLALFCILFIPIGAVKFGEGLVDSQNREEKK